MVQAADTADQRQLYALRADLVRLIDPLRSPGHLLQEALLKCNQMAMGEANSL